MATKKKTDSTKSAAKRAPKTKKTAAETKKIVTKLPKAKTTGAKTKKAEPKEKKVATKAAGPASKRTAKTDASKVKTKASAVKKRKAKAKAEVAFAGLRIGDSVVDPIGDTTDGEGGTYIGDAEAQAQAELAAFRADTTFAAMDSGLEAGPGLERAQSAMEARARKAAERAARAEAEAEESGEPGAGPEAREPGKLERLQKILSQAGIASRRRAEEMIVAGRVMVNGQVVTTLGSKADVARDHIRVDGKLLHGAERHRYFLLNKPRGYVTTVSDPEGRPTVVQFFAKMHERLYPVGRLDFQSEGLLLMTNDGELANLLTKAESGVEKTYLVKVAGQPSAEQLERLRAGVAIEKGEAGSERLRTAPARIQQVRQGENPWYEVVLTEGRNRELRKMFAAIGHFAEKIRRVGYGPLVLDVEPGKMRELTLEEVHALRLTAEGKMKPRRMNVDRMLPKDAGIPSGKRAEKARGGKFGAQRFDRRQSGEAFGRRDHAFGTDKRQSERSERGIPGPKGGTWDTQRREGQRSFGSKPRFDRPRFEKRDFGGGLGESGGERREFRGDPRREQGEARGEKPIRQREEQGQRTGWKPREFGGERKPFSGGKPGFGRKREGQRPFGSKRRFDRPRFEKRDFGGGQSESGGERRESRGGPRREFGSGPGRGEGRALGSKPRFEKRDFGGARGEGREARFEGARKPFKPRSEKPQFERGERPQFKRSERPAFDRGEGRPFEKRVGERRGNFTGRREDRPDKKFQRGPKFGAKPGGFGNSRGGKGGRFGGDRGRKFGSSKPGAARGGWKRG
jgi:pseudouridine synthase